MFCERLQISYHIGENTRMKFLGVDKDVGKRKLSHSVGGIYTLGDNLAKVLEYTLD